LKVRNDLLTQGYGVDRAKSSTLRFVFLRRYTKRCGQESTEAEVPRLYIGKQQPRLFIRETAQPENKT
jgi:hypothetical protein